MDGSFDFIVFLHTFLLLVLFINSISRLFRIHGSNIYSYVCFVHPCVSDIALAIYIRGYGFDVHHDPASTSCRL